MKKIRKEKVEEMAYLVLKNTIEDTENLASIAVNAAAYYRDNYIKTHYLEGLEAKRKEAERSAANLLKAIESGVISETITNRLIELEAQKATLDEAIQAENIRLTLFEDEHSIKMYMKKFMEIEINSPETRDAVLSYFVDKIYLYEDKMVVTFFYSEDRTEISFDDMGGFVLCPFVKAEPKSSTSDASAPWNKRPHKNHCLKKQDFCVGAFCIAGKPKSGIVQDPGGCFRINFILHRFNIALILHFTFVIYDSQCAKEHKRKQRNVKLVLGVFAE
ncbi:hypothetical protein [[Ruminococcus] torques]|uniref:hypothetical protein n=1 Tax=[Ruminococcus] torques TaxID=33039 RepID=UPI0027BA97F0|nr:hypothetical protein [[Ruminococcus] torques]